MIKPVQSPTARHWLRWNLNPSLLDARDCPFCSISSSPSGSSPADSGILPLSHSFPMHISKCSHSISGTIANTVANNGQGVLTVGQHHRKTAALLSPAAPVYLHALPSGLASGSHWWKCQVCTKATLFLLPPGRLRLTWLVPQARQDVVSSMLHLSSSSLPKLPASHLFPSGFDMVELNCRGGVEMGAVGWTDCTVTTASLTPLSAKPAADTLGFWIPSGLFMSAHSPLWQLQVKSQIKFFSSP